MTPTAINKTSRGLHVTLVTRDSRNDKWASDCSIVAPHNKGNMFHMAAVWPVNRPAVCECNSLGSGQWEHTVARSPTMWLNRDGRGKRWMAEDRGSLGDSWCEQRDIHVLNKSLAEQRGAEHKDIEGPLSQQRNGNTRPTKRRQKPLNMSHRELWGCRFLC